MCLWGDGIYKISDIFDLLGKGASKYIRSMYKQLQYTLSNLRKFKLSIMCLTQNIFIIKTLDSKVIHSFIALIINIMFMEISVRLWL